MEPPAPRAGRAHFKNIALCILVAYFLYILAMGPVARLGATGAISQPVGRALFIPLLPLSHIPIIRHLLGQYLGLWLPESP
jgi:hypothetical protein